jgi:hypothetical protein
MVILGHTIRNPAVRRQTSYDWYMISHIYASTDQTKVHKAIVQLQAERRWVSVPSVYWQIPILRFILQVVTGTPIVRARFPCERYCSSQCMR